MKLLDLQEAKYHGTGLSQSERETIIHDIRKNIPIKHVNTDDDWRISLEVRPRGDNDVDEYDYDDAHGALTQMFGQPDKIDGYSSGHFRKGVHPRWVVKDHQIILTHGYGDVDIEISQLR